MSSQTIWILCSKTQVWHMLDIGSPQKIGAKEPPMAALSCGHPDVTGPWALLKPEGELPPMGGVCASCKCNYQVGNSKKKD